MEDRSSARLAGDRLAKAHPASDPFAAAIRSTRMSMIITDPRQDDNPIIFANSAFGKLTGYDPESVIGRNCRFLQGPNTDRAVITRLGKAVGANRDINVDVLNYTRDGQPFWNALYVSPVFDDAGDVIYFFSSQLDITERKERELRLSDTRDVLEEEVARRTSELAAALERQTVLLHEVDHRVKNNLQLISSLILLHIRRIPDLETQASLRGMLNRITALSTIHKRLYGESVDRFDLSAFIRDLSDDLLGVTGREEVSFELDLVPALLPATKAAPVALMVNEILTNALKHAFPDRSGTVRVTVRTDGDRFNLAIEDDGVGHKTNGSAGGGGFGSHIVDLLKRQIGAEVHTQHAPGGTRVTVSFATGRG